MITGKIKSTLRQFAAEAYYTSKHFLKRLRGKVLILTYHRVLPGKERNQQFIQPGMYVQNNVFEKQMLFLEKYFSILSFAELLDLWNKETLRKDQRYCVITFDDGWLDNYIYAYPILREHNIPATIFLPVVFIGTNQWFWPDKIGYILRQCDFDSLTMVNKEFITLLRRRYPWMKQLNGVRHNEEIDLLINICKRQPEEEIHDFIMQMTKNFNLDFPDERVLINWDEVEEMSQHGIAFGSHSSTHKILTKLPAKESQKEIEESLYILRQKNINYIPIFCYPNGNYNQEIIRQVKAADYQAAVSTRFGFEDGLPQDLFSLKRISIHNDITATIPLFAFHISGLNHISNITSS